MQNVEKCLNFWKFAYEFIVYKRKSLNNLKRIEWSVDFMKTWKVVDKYNPHKVWIIKRIKDRHYYANQMICGKMFYSRYQRITKDRWTDILEGVR